MPEPADNITFGPWPRGVDYSRPADEIPRDTLYSTQDVEIGNAGQAIKRNGVAKLNASAMNSGATVTACGNQRFSAASSATFAVAGNQFIEDVGGTPADRTGGLTITAADDNTWKFVNCAGTLVGHNGVSGDSLLKWTAAGGNAAAWTVSARFTTCEWVEWWDRRCWAGNLSSGVARVWYSNDDDVETWGATNFFTFDEDVSGIKRWIRGIVVHTDISLSILSATGNASTPYRRMDLMLESEGLGGTVSGRAIANIPGFGQVFVRRDGIYALQGASKDSVVKISDRIDGSRYWDDLNKDRLSESFVTLYPVKNEAWFWLPNGSSQTNMNNVMILNWQHSRKAGHPVWYGPYTGLTRNCGALISDQPHFGDFTGFVFTHDSGTNDNGSAIAGQFETSMEAPMGGTTEVAWGRGKARVFFEIKGSHQVSFQQISPDIAASAQTLGMGASYDAIGTTFMIGFSKIAENSEIAYADLIQSGDSPFTRWKVRNASADEAFSIRRIISTFNPTGAVRRDDSGVH